MWGSLDTGKTVMTWFQSTQKPEGTSTMDGKLATCSFGAGLWSYEIITSQRKVLSERFIKCYAENWTVQAEMSGQADSNWRGSSYGWNGWTWIRKDFWTTIKIGTGKIINERMHVIKNFFWMKINEQYWILLRDCGWILMSYGGMNDAASQGQWLMHKDQRTFKVQ